MSSGAKPCVLLVQSAWTAAVQHTSNALCPVSIIVMTCSLRRTACHSIATSGSIP
ncbi:hypothetical protein EXIGLDRAFT_733569 [Exidia glandulosa HHB12029]|uniref:Uncharacterized protein n=1 Tax=Exidia glandulosa HHB12029 TaxID=1314781 RepID=A0A165B9N7_EXIGL|nr:hypothetical protein EXIGLDRAFT_733569 [Exidia glandulosa HHB12029]